VDEGTLEAGHLRLVAPSHEPSDLAAVPLAGLSLAAVERAVIQQTLAQLRGNRTRAAAALGIAPSTLYEKIRRYEL
jgi:DNA-binding NtrC family response regulator